MGKKCCSYAWESSVASWITLIGTGLGCLLIKYFDDRSNLIRQIDYRQTLAKLKLAEDSNEPITYEDAKNSDKFGTLGYNWEIRPNDNREIYALRSVPLNHSSIIVKNSSHITGQWTRTSSSLIQAKKTNGVFCLDTDRANALLEYVRNDKDVVAINDADVKAAVEILMEAWNTYMIVEPDARYRAQFKDVTYERESRMKDPVFIKVVVPIEQNYTPITHIRWTEINKKYASLFWKAGHYPIYKSGP